MNDKARERHVAEIKAVQAELDVSTGFHRKDTFRRLIRLKRELKQYDLLRYGNKGKA